MLRRYSGARFYRKDTWGKWLLYHEGKLGVLESIPLYTADMSTAWQVVEKMKSYMHPLPPLATKHDLTIADNFLVHIWEATGKRGMEAIFAYTPEMICIAALKAVGVAIS